MLDQLSRVVVRAGWSGPMRVPHLIGRRDNATRPPLDRLFVLSHARSRLERKHQFTPRDAGAIVFHPVSPSDFVAIVGRAEGVIADMASDTTVAGSNDPYAFGWLILHNDNFDELLVGAHGITASLEAAGWSEKLFCAVFAFEDRRKHPMYWIYNYEWGAFYPMAPANGNHHRDPQREHLMRAELRADDTAEPALGAWFPLRGIPI